MEETIKRNNPVVLLNIGKSYNTSFLIEEARKKDWRFFDLDQFGTHYIPTGINIIGIITNLLPDNPFCQKFRNMGYPIVRMGKLPHPQDKLQPVVLPDLFKAGIMAAEHYASRGFKDVAFLGHTPWGDAEALFGGFLQKSKELGMEMNLKRKKPIFEVADFIKPAEKDEYVRNFRHNELTEWLNSLPKPVGILAYNFGLASHIDLVCNSLDISVPGEVSILCYRDIPECRMSYTPLSAIDIGLKKIAKQAVELLEDLINENPPEESRVFVAPSGIVLRQSTDILAVADAGVGKALTYIWENISNPISVEDIAEASGVPLRTLKRSFKKCLKRSMTEELLRKRLETACEMLRNNMAVYDVAKAVGFSSKSYFHKRFSEAYGMTPNTFKAKKHNY